MSVPVPTTRFLDFRALWGGGDVVDVQLMQWTGRRRFLESREKLRGAFAGGFGGLRLWQGCADCHARIQQQPRAGDPGTFDVEQQLLDCRFRGLRRPAVARRFGIASCAVLSSRAGARHGCRRTGWRTFVDANLQNAASISFVSHSLGARVILEAISQMKLPVRRRDFHGRAPSTTTA